MELNPDLQEKKIFLIEALKRTYKVQYDAIRPLPYIKDKLYCVDKVFVEGGVEVCLAPELTPCTRGSSGRLESYKNIYTDFRFKSKRRIIQGEPGYGKSTLTLQLAYDWCNDVSDSPMNNVEILILLRLRQLGSVKSLFRAIKSFLLFHEPRVSKHEIEKIIRSCSSVHIILDGYDEYPGRDINDNDDVHRIIKMELFADFDVTLTTRYLPECLRKETKMTKLTGFDDKARDEYIRKAVVGNNHKVVEQIKQRLYENSILADLCQVPLIFVMFAHIAHDERDFMKFKSVTQFFKHMIICFYDHLKQKFKDNKSNEFYLHEMEHDELDKIAFEGLHKKNQQLSWIKTEFRQRVGPESYDQYILIGILVEEYVVSIDSTGDNVLFTTMVRFYHKLFCEWYAAHHLVTLVKNAQDLFDMLRFLDPFDLQYLFRFACGLDPDAGKKLINHLKRLQGGHTFAILCILEQTGDVNDIMDSVKDLCSRDVKVKRGDSALLQRSTTQLLEIAANNNIPISCLHLDYSSMKFEGDTIILHSGISLPKLPTVEKLQIAGNKEQYDNGGTLTVHDILNLFHYGMKCGRIKELMFVQLQLPISLSPEVLRDVMKTRNIQVRWRPFDIDFHLDLQNGQWKVDGTQVIENFCSSTVSINKKDSKLQQMSTVQLLHVAQRHNIQISCLHLDYSSMKFEGDTIILLSGISLPKDLTVEKIHIAGSKEQYGNTGTVTDNDVLNLFHYGIKCGRIKELMFAQLQLPISVSPEVLTDVMKTRNIQVRWRPFDIDFHLDLQNGQWEVVDTQVLKNIRCSTVSIYGKHSVLQQRSTVQLLHVANNHNIPISCLHLEYSSMKFEDNTVILHSGISLPILPTVEKIHIAGSKEQYGNRGTLTVDDVLNFFHYGMKCGRIKELMFVQLQLPTSVSPEVFTDVMKTRNIQVRWRPFDDDFHLDLQNGQWEVDDSQKMEHICSSIVYINAIDSKLQQGSTSQLLHVAHRHNIPITCLHLKDSFSVIDAGNLILKSGLHMSCPASVKKVVINTRRRREMAETEFVDILMFVQQSHMLEELQFDQLQLPNSVSPESFTDKIRLRNIRVRWRPFDIDFHMDLQSGHWEVDDSQKMEDICSSIVYINAKDSKLQQGSTSQLLHVAHIYNIPITCLYLKDSFSEIDAGNLILTSGLHLSCPASVKKVVIDTEKGRELTETEVVDILMFVQQSHMLEELEFDQLQLPNSVSPESFTDKIRLRNIRVRWRPFDIDFYLDLQSGQWEVDNIDTLRQLCSDTIHICESEEIFEQKYTIMFMNIASNHEIPISCLHFDNSSIKFEGDTIILQSGISLPILSTVQKIHIAGSNEAYENTEPSTIRFKPQFGLHLDEQSVNQETLTEKNILNWFSYGMKCRTIKELMFDQLQLPTSVSLKAFKNIMKTRNIQVRWRPFDIDFHLDLQNGHWEFDNIDTLRQLCSDTVYIKNSDGILKQTSTIMFMNIASSHEIPISCLHLDYSSIKFEGDIMILHSGISLPILPTVEKIHIVGDEALYNNSDSLPPIVPCEDGNLTPSFYFEHPYPRPVVPQSANQETITEKDILNLFRHGMKCRRIKELMFGQLQLPTSVSPEELTDITKTRNIAVRWRPFDIDFHLDLQSGQWEVDDSQVMEDICSSTVCINATDSKLHQGSTLQLLHVAHRHNIPITCLYLKNSFSNIDAGIILKSELNLSCPASVKKVVIQTEEGRDMTETEVVDILMFVQQSHMLEELEFHGCLLPLTFSSESIPAELKSRNIKVFWSNYGYILNLQSGLWEVDNEDVVRKLCTKGIYIQRYVSQLLQRCTIQLLENASYHDIPITCLYLKKTFSYIDAGNIILETKLHLSCPASVKKVVIDTKEGREMTETEVVDILMFVQQSHTLEELQFDGCLLPLTFSLELIPSKLKSRKIKVSWSTYGYILNLQSGLWEVDDADKVKHLCTNDVDIDCNGSELLQRCTIKLLESASYHEIPIFCLCLDGSFSKIDAGDVILKSGLRLSCPVSVKKVEIHTDGGREMTETEVVDILMFVKQSHMLKELKFWYCLLPQSIPAESIPSILKSRNVKVSWGSGFGWLELNLQSGRWMDHYTRQKMTNTEYNDTVTRFRDIYKDAEWQKARISSESESEIQTESESDNEYNK